MRCIHVYAASGSSPRSAPASARDAETSAAFAAVNLGSARKPGPKTARRRARSRSRRASSSVSGGAARLVAADARRRAVSVRRARACAGSLPGEGTAPGTPNAATPSSGARRSAPLASAVVNAVCAFASAFSAALDPTLELVEVEAAHGVGVRGLQVGTVQGSRTREQALCAGGDLDQVAEAAPGTCAAEVDTQGRGRRTTPGRMHAHVEDTLHDLLRSAVGTSGRPHQVDRGETQVSQWDVVRGDHLAIGPELLDPRADIGRGAEQPAGPGVEDGVGQRAR